MFIEEEIIACPYCNQLYRINCYVSWSVNKNTRFYSDGHIEGRYPDFISIVKCLNTLCCKYFDAEKEKSIYQYDARQTKDNTEHKEWVNLILLKNIGISELEDALETEFCKKLENEKKVRVRLLRRYNDIFRNDRDNIVLAEIHHKMLKNIEKLIKLFSDSFTFEDKVLLAELYREKGDFKTCMELIRNITPINEDENIIRGSIYNYAEAGDNKVFEV